MTEGIQQHEIVLKYRDLGGVGDRIAQVVGQNISRINGLLPSGFSFTGDYSIDRGANQLHLYILERGYNLLPLSVIIAIIALIVALVGLAWYDGMRYIENGILKATLTVTQEGIQKIQDIVNNPNLTDAQKIELIKAVLAEIPKIVIPPPGNGGGINGIIAGASGLILLLIAWQLIKK